jgi:hypothetical protein
MDNTVATFKLNNLFKNQGFDNCKADLMANGSVKLTTSVGWTIFQPSALSRAMIIIDKGKPEELSMDEFLLILLRLNVPNLDGMTTSAPYEKISPDRAPVINPIPLADTPKLITSSAPTTPLILDPAPIIPVESKRIAGISSAPTPEKKVVATAPAMAPVPTKKSKNIVKK